MLLDAADITMQVSQLYWYIVTSFIPKLYLYLAYMLQDQSLYQLPT